MNDHDDRNQPTPNGDSDDREEEALYRLFESAGPRSDIPAEDIDAITMAAKTAWKRETARRSTETTATTFEPRNRSFFGGLAALAATLIVALGLAWWWSTDESGGLTHTASAATVEFISGSVVVQYEESGRRQLVAGDVVPVGALLATDLLSIGSGDDNGSAAGTIDPSPNRASLRLANGLILRLDAGTGLRLAESAAVDLLRGAVYVDSDRTEVRQRASGEEVTESRYGGSLIEVRTPLGVAHDVGTQFVVRLVASTDGEVDSLLVRVREGMVVTEHGGLSLSANAGEELVLAPSGAVERRAVAGFGPDWDWVLAAAPAFEAEGRDLREFLEWTARETGRTLTLEGDLAESADEIVLHGDLSGLRPDQALYTVLPGAGLEALQHGEELIIRRRQAFRTPN